MSTFDGIVQNFPDIRIDYFRLHPNRPPSLACFLSHVHSDHLMGLESLKSPFVYCSAATKRILLRMEKYPHRMNFAKGILEARKQTYGHLKLVLRALPLETPTELELSPKVRIRVTLFDANHCPGAVMFLIEGDGKAVLYTGDIRAEPWWINAISRHPVLVPYTYGNERLDCIYLDTTFASNDDIYREFPTKADGLAELISKVKSYPADTLYYFRSWTFGYEDVWIGLSAALKSKIHVDDYQLRLFSSLVDENRDSSIADGSALIGFQLGHQYHQGCLTRDSSAKIHSCEPGTACHAELVAKKNVVWITPLISRTKEGIEVRELGAGGGGGDLYQTPELDLTDPPAKQTFADLCMDLTKDPDLLSRLTNPKSVIKEERDVRLSLEGLGLNFDENITLTNLINLIFQKPGKVRPSNVAFFDDLNFSNTIHFPYSRHASYEELRQLVSVFHPKDICPNTVDERSWSEEVSMQYLFGDLCSEQRWHYDQKNRAFAQKRQEERILLGKRKRAEHDNGETQRSELSEDLFETAEGDPEGDCLPVGPQRGRTKTSSAELVPPTTSYTTQVSTVKHASVRPKDSQAQGEAPGEAITSQAESDDEPHDQEQAEQIDAIRVAIHATKKGNDGISGDQDHEPVSTPPLVRKLTADEVVKTHEIQRTSRMKGDGKSCEEEFGDSDDEDSESEVDSTQMSLTASEFDSQQPSANYTKTKADYGEESGMGLPLDGNQDEPRLLDSAPSSEDARRRARLQAREEAYRAARLCLLHKDSGDWEDLGSRAIGRRDHCEEEILL